MSTPEPTLTEVVQADLDDYFCDHADEPDPKWFAGACERDGRFDWDEYWDEVTRQHWARREAPKRTELDWPVIFAMEKQTNGYAQLPSGPRLTLEESHALLHELDRLIADTTTNDLKRLEICSPLDKACLRRRVTQIMVVGVDAIQYLNDADIKALRDEAYVAGDDTTHKACVDALRRGNGRDVARRIVCEIINRLRPACIKLDAGVRMVAD